jgi:hypothetical protein
MKRTTLTLSLALVLSAVAGCDDSGGDAGMVGGRSYPKVGSHVDVQFRRGYLGLASDKPTTPMGEGMNMNLGASGVMKGINDEFLILGVHGETNRELWIPRDTILLLDVTRAAE